VKGTDLKLRVSFWWGAGIELLLLASAVVLGWAISVPWPDRWRWDLTDGVLGAVGAVPMLLLFWWLFHTETKVLRRIREFLERVVRPALKEWSVAQLLAISILAGAGEEALFRGLLQGGLERWVGPLPALILASAVFGACHWITPTYALVAGLMGCTLGGLWWWTGNLLTPMVAHGVYDFVALVWLLRVRTD
jgi:uncharacterized protein